MKGIIMDNIERRTDLIKIIEAVDISPTMYSNAVKKYESLAGYLESHGLNADFYPQGSFALGTVIRPYAKDNDKSYDLDFICQVYTDKDNISPKELRDQIKDILEAGELYGGKLVVEDECFTIEYAEIGSVGFSIDIVPAADETNDKKMKLQSESDRPDLIGTSIAIPRNSQQKVYNWITNNPKGYRKWFDEINAPFAYCTRDEYRKRMFESNRELFSSIEDVPEELNRSSLQRVIQILKYHRDVYYFRAFGEKANSMKPISAIINTIVARISEKADPALSPIELLQFVLSEFSVYSKQTKHSEMYFKQNYPGKTVIKKEKGKWIIENPANPEDNLANKWNENSKIPEAFFKWVSVAKVQLIDSLYLSDESFRADIEAAFGRKTVQNAWGTKYYNETPKVIPSNKYAKPWRNN